MSVLQNGMILLKCKLLLVVLIKKIAITDSVNNGVMANILVCNVVTMIFVEKVLLVKNLNGIPLKRFAILICAKLMLTASNGEMKSNIACLENAGDQI
jgi:hypothetical protein